MNFKKHCDLDLRLVILAELVLCQNQVLNIANLDFASMNFLIINGEEPTTNLRRLDIATDAHRFKESAKMELPDLIDLNPKQYKVELFGQFLPSILRKGRVVSIYSRAVNILCPNQLLASVVAEPSQMTVCSLTSSHLFQSPLTVRFIKIGDDAIFSDKVLKIGALRLNLNETKSWKGVIRLASTRGFCLSNIAHAKKTLLQIGKNGSLIGLIHPQKRDNPFVRKALQLCRRNRYGAEGDKMRIRLEDFIGLGVGFTPSGDDLAVGMLAGERVLHHLVSEAGEGSDFKGNTLKKRELDKSKIWQAAKKTNYGGRTILWQALKGHFPQYVINAIKGFALAKGKKDINDVVNVAVRHGETSGTDTLLGFLLYFDEMVEFI